MKLDVSARLRLLAILPEQGNLLTLKIVRELREELSFSEDEHKIMKLVVKEDRITWSDKAGEKDVAIGDQSKELIEKRLRELNEKDELTLPDLDLWEKFIGGEGEGDAK
jgi:hypothetical protein